MSSTAVLLLVALFVAYAAFAIPVIFQFRAYCERVANATNRINEFRDKRSVDDGGNNAFEREQWWKLLNGKFREYTDPILVTEAAVLSRKVRLSMLLAIGLVIAFPFVAGLR
jgi:hypothetical protein